MGKVSDCYLDAMYITEILRSTHNTRIEHIWVEFGGRFARQWRAFFLRLEHRHQLDRYNPEHLWLLHHLFLEEINHDCIVFCDEWNAHPISGEGHNQSPNVSHWSFFTALLTPILS